MELPLNANTATYFCRIYFICISYINGQGLTQNTRGPVNPDKRSTPLGIQSTAINLTRLEFTYHNSVTHGAAHKTNYYFVSCLA